EVRAGCHTGEVELAGDDVRGIAVHIGARLASLAGGGEVLVSSTVKDLVAGSGLVFEDAGEHELKGVPDRWRLSGGASSEWWSSSASRPNESAGLGYGLGEERDHGHHAFRRDRHRAGDGGARGVRRGRCGG
ncbi:MAG TPA: hypothetical protein VJO36_07080, partial [Actinomycetota bacterium]|nr:hypothetical protein [Actinomycetota bacterium]